MKIILAGPDLNRGRWGSPDVGGVALADLLDLVNGIALRDFRDFRDFLDAVGLLRGMYYYV